MLQEFSPQVTETTMERASGSHRRWSFIRLIAALVITPTVLIYNYGVVLVYGMMDGRTDPLALARLAGGIAVVMLLTVGLSRRLASPRTDRIVAAVLSGVWLLVTALLIWLRSGDSMPRPVLMLLFVPATVWVAWLAWMLYRPWSWALRFVVLGASILAAIPFPLLVHAAGLTGAANVNFVWRSTAPSAAAGQSVPEDEAAVDAGLAIDLAQTGADDYPQFLGPHRTGVVADARLSSDWQTRPPREVWRRAVGEGWSAFAVVGNYCVTQEQRGSEEAIVCRRLSDGAHVWTRAYAARFDSTTGGSNMGGTGPRATPAIQDRKVLAVGATGILHCLDGGNGAVLWSTDIQKDNDGKTIAHGVCASPLVVDDRVVVAPTGNSAASLAAYHAGTGEQAWRAGKHSASYGSPALAELCGRRQILLYTENGVDSHDDATGDFLWSHTWTNHVRVNCSQPLIIDGPAGRVMVCTDYDNGSVLLEVQPGPEGWSVREIWKSPREMKTKFTTAVRLGDEVYGLDDGILACLSLASGKRLWKGGRYQHGQVLLAGKLLLVQAESGEVVLVRLNPKGLDELGRLPALSGKTWNNPALAGRYLLVRNDHEAACYELPIEGDAP